MDSSDPLVTADVKMEIDVAEEEEEEPETPLAYSETDGHHTDFSTTGDDTVKNTDNTASVERDGDVQNPEISLEPAIKVEPGVRLKLETSKEFGINLEPDKKLQSNSVPIVYCDMNYDTDKTLSTKQKPLTTESPSAEGSRMSCVFGLCGACVQLFSQLVQHVSTHTGQKPHTVTTEQKTSTADSACIDVQTSADTPSERTSRATFQKPHACTKDGLSGARTGQKPHICTECGARFSFSGLKRHMLTHTGQKPHKCIECGDGFNQLGNLKRHMLTHTGEKLYTCTKCSACFAHSNTLKRHVLICTGQKPHKCTQCCASFTHAGRLKRHAMTHTEQKPHKCTE